MLITTMLCHHAQDVYPGGGTMVEFVKISPQGNVLEIRDVSDKYRDKPYVWDEEE
ncbi:MAG: hypothetical protein IMZ43_08745 [Thermoplasmata archaeon]|nr:hypothetical protein [Thermoplasmata archaeon]